MDAGRELDALVAEHAMGLVVVWDERGLPTDWSPLQGGTLADLDTKQPRISYRVPCIDSVDGDPVPEYSTDIAAAWEVWDHLGEAFGYMALARFGHAPSEARYVVHAGEYGKVAGDPIATAPLAICLAALKAVGCDL